MIVCKRMSPCAVDRAQKVMTGPEVGLLIGQRWENKIIVSAYL